MLCDTYQHKDCSVITDGRTDGLYLRLRLVTPRIRGLMPGLTVQHVATALVRAGALIWQNILQLGKVL